MINLAQISHFLPKKSGKIQKMHSRWKFGSQFAFLHLPEHANTWNSTKSRNSTTDENLAQISHFCPQIRAKSRKCSRDENSDRFSHSCTFRTCKHLKSGKIQKFHCRWKFVSNFTFLHPRAPQSGNLLITWNPAKSRNSTANENLGQISHFCQQNRAKSRKWTPDENSARITHSCTSRSCNTFEIL